MWLARNPVSDQDRPGLARVAHSTGRRVTDESTWSEPGCLGGDWPPVLLQGPRPSPVTRSASRRGDPSWSPVAGNGSGGRPGSSTTGSTGCVGVTMWIQRVSGEVGRRLGRGGGRRHRRARWRARSPGATIGRCAPGAGERKDDQNEDQALSHVCITRRGPGPNIPQLREMDRPTASRAVGLGHPRRRPSRGAFAFGGFGPTTDCDAAPAEDGAGRAHVLPVRSRSDRRDGRTLWRSASGWSDRAFEGSRTRGS